jgi:hypothetical protein
MVLHASCVDTYSTSCELLQYFFFFLVFEDEVGVPRTCDRVGAAF